MHVSCRQRHLPDQRVRFVHRDMRLITVMRLAFFYCIACLTITAGLIVLRRRAARGLQQRRIHQRAGFQDQALGLQLLIDQRQQVFMQPMFAQPLAETPQGGFIRHGVLQIQTDKAPPAQTVAHQLLALRIGQPIAVLEQTHLEKHQRRAGRTSRLRRIHGLQGLFQGLSRQRPVKPFQEIIRGRGDHHIVQKAKLGITRRLHICRTFYSKNKFQDFCRDSKLST